VSRGDQLWAADLGAGANAGQFPRGINQLLQGERRLPLGRWPNADDPAFDNGYSYIERQPSETTIEDDELPLEDWTGATIRLKTIRWLLLNRRVGSSSGTSLVLENGVECWDGCGASASGHGWGYQITHHPATLDREGEWDYDPESQTVLLYAASEPTEVEGSVIPADVENVEDPGMRGIIVLGEHLGAEIRHVVVENLRIENGFRNGITTPTNLATDENSDLVIRCNTIRNVDSVGLDLATWVFDAGEASGWRGGRDQIIANNVIDGPNHFGIRSYAIRTTFQDNVIRSVGLAENLGMSGLGCDFEGSNCTEHGDGVFMTTDQIANTSHSNVFRHNRIEGTGYCGLDMFGGTITVEENIFLDTCVTKGDCGAIRSFGGGDYAGTAVHDLTLRRNVIDGVPGNTDGASASFAGAFGFGLYIDNHSRDILADGNVIANTTEHAILYQNSSGVVRNNLAVVTQQGLPLTFSADSQIDESFGNTWVSLIPSAPLVMGDIQRLLASDDNIFFNPYFDGAVDDGNGTGWTLAEWQATSQMDANSTAAWYALSPTEPVNVEVFVNRTSDTESIPLTGAYVDLRQQPVSSPLVLPPYSGAVLVAE
jgi:hypothetical protein